MVGGPLILWYGAVVALVAAGLLLSPTLEFPRSWVLLGLAVVTSGAGAHLLARAHPEYRYYLHKPPTAFYWTAPVALTAGGALFTLQLLGGPFTLVGMGVTSAGVALVLYCQYALAEPGRAPPAYARLITNLSIYLAAFLLFVSIHNSGLGLPLAPVVLGSLSGLLSLELFREGRDRPWREAGYALVLAVLIAELSWVLQYFPLGKIITSLVLLLGFYLLTGLIHNHLIGRLSPWIALEFVFVTAVGLGVLFGFQTLGG